jgi:cytochrome P450
VTLAGGLAQIDFTDLDNFADGFPHSLFEVHRREAPVYWHEPTDNTPDGEGFWSVASYAETLAVFRDPQIYSSMTGGSREFGGTLLQDLSIAGQVLNMMDDPRHSQIRKLVSSGLTPRMIGLVEDDLRAGAAAARLGRAGSAVRLPGRHRRRTADADDLHPAGSAGIRTTLAVPRHRAAVRLRYGPQGSDRASGADVR